MRGCGITTAALLLLERGIPNQPDTGYRPGYLALCAHDDKADHEHLPLMCEMGEAANLSCEHIVLLAHCTLQRCL